jgi:two-component system chemotaxis response regulator CheB
VKSKLDSFARRPFGLIAIGCSAGGFDALLELLPHFPATYSPAVVIAIHLSPHSRNSIAEVLQPRCLLRLKEAEDKESIVSGTVYFAPPGYHLLVEPDHTFSLSSEDPVNFSRPSIDVLFESAGIAYRDRVLGILLTGASSDGAKGIATIHTLRGTVFVQDPADAKHPTMPKSALDLVRPDAIFSLSELGQFFAGKLATGGHDG